MKHFWKLGLFLVIGLALLSCNKDEVTFALTDATAISHNSATFNASVAANITITDKGICYSSQNSMPTTTNSKISKGSGTSSFTVTLNNLEENTVYYARPYATTNGATYYGEVKMFTTLEDTDFVYLILPDKYLANCIDIQNFNPPYGTIYSNKELAVIAHQKFSVVQISLNGNKVGYYSLPCTIPLYPDFNADFNAVQISPAVRDANSAMTIIPYYFTLPISRRLENLEPGKEYKFSNFLFEYISNVEFPVLETFEQTTHFAPNDANSASMSICYDAELNNNIGKITLEGSQAYFDVVTPYFHLQGGGGKNQFWEIYYKSDNGIMNTHLNFRNSPTEVIHKDVCVLPETNGLWEKIYIDISDIIRVASDMDPQISVRLQITGLKNDDTKPAYFYFGNIKLITMN